MNLNKQYDLAVILMINLSYWDKTKQTWLPYFGTHWIHKLLSKYADIVKARINEQIN